MATIQEQRKEALSALYNQVKDYYKGEVKAYLVANQITTQTKLDELERGFGKNALRLLWNVVTNGMGKAVEGFIDMPVGILAGFLEAFSGVDKDIINFYTDENGVVRAQKGLGLDEYVVKALDGITQKEAYDFNELLQQTYNTPIYEEYMSGRIDEREVLKALYSSNYNYYSRSDSAAGMKVNINGEEYIFNGMNGYFYDKDEYGVWQNTTTMRNDDYTRELDRFKTNPMYNKAQEMINWIKKDLTKEFTDLVWDNKQFAIDNSVVNQILSGVTQMLPAFALTMIGAPALASTYFFGMSYGMGVEEGLNRGLDIGSANNYGLTNALIETGIESIGGYSFGIGKTSWAFKDIANAFLEEGMEELYGGILNPFVDSIFGLEDDPWGKLTSKEYMGELGLQFLGGAISGAIWGGINKSVFQGTKQEQAVNKFYNLVESEIKNPEKSKKKFNQRLDLVLELANKGIDADTKGNTIIDSRRQETLDKRRSRLENMGSFVFFNEQTNKFEKTTMAEQFSGDLRAFQRTKNGNVVISSETHAISRDIYGQEIASVSPTGSEIKVATIEQIENHQNPEVKKTFERAQTLNSNVVFFDGKHNQNSFQMDNVAYININAKNVGVDLLVHEVAHNAQKGLYGAKVKAEYKAFEKAVLENFDAYAAELGYTKAELEAKYKNKVDKANLKNEIVANFIEKMFNNDAIVKKVAKHKGAVALINNIKQFFGSKNVGVALKSEMKAELRELQDRFQSILTKYQVQERRQQMANVFRAIIQEQSINYEQIEQIVALTEGMLAKTGKYSAAERKQIIRDLITNLTNNYRVNNVQFSLFFEENFAIPNTMENIALLEAIINVENNLVDFVNKNEKLFENLKALDGRYQELFGKSLFDYADKYERAQQVLLSALVDDTFNKLVYDNLTNQEYSAFLDFYSDRSVLGAIRTRFNNEGVPMVVAFYKTLVSISNAQYSIDNNPQANAMSKILEIFDGIIKKDGGKFVIQTNQGYEEMTGKLNVKNMRGRFYETNLDTGAISIKKRAGLNPIYYIPQGEVVPFNKLTLKQQEVFNELRKLPIDIFVFQSNQAFGYINVANTITSQGLMAINLDALDYTYTRSNKFQAMVLNTAIHEQMHLIFHTDEKSAIAFAGALRDVLFIKDNNGNISINQEVWNLYSTEKQTKFLDYFNDSYVKMFLSRKINELDIYKLLNGFANNVYLTFDEESVLDEFLAQSVGILLRSDVASLKINNLDAIWLEAKRLGALDLLNVAMDNYSDLKKAYYTMLNQYVSNLEAAAKTQGKLQGKTAIYSEMSGGQYQTKEQFIKAVADKEVLALRMLDIFTEIADLLPKALEVVEASVDADGNEVFEVTNEATLLAGVPNVASVVNEVLDTLKIIVENHAEAVQIQNAITAVGKYIQIFKKMKKDARITDLQEYINNLKTIIGFVNKNQIVLDIFNLDALELQKHLMEIEQITDAYIKDTTGAIVVKDITDVLKKSPLLNASLQDVIIRELVDIVGFYVNKSLNAQAKNILRSIDKKMLSFAARGQGKNVGIFRGIEAVAEVFRDYMKDVARFGGEAPLSLVQKMEQMKAKIIQTIEQYFNVPTTPLKAEMFEEIVDGKNYIRGVNNEEFKLKDTVKIDYSQNVDGSNHLLPRVSAENYWVIQQWLNTFNNLENFATKNYAINGEIRTFLELKNRNVMDAFSMMIEALSIKRTNVLGGGEGLTTRETASIILEQIERMRGENIAINLGIIGFLTHAMPPQYTIEIFALQYQEALKKLKAAEDIKAQNNPNFKRTNYDNNFFNNFLTEYVNSAQKQEAVSKATADLARKFDEKWKQTFGRKVDYKKEMNEKVALDNEFFLGLLKIDHNAIVKNARIDFNAKRQEARDINKQIKLEQDQANKSMEKGDIKQAQVHNDNVKSLKSDLKKIKQDKFFTFEGAYEFHLKEHTDKNGKKTVELTKGQILELYRSYQREQSMHEKVASGQDVDGYTNHLTRYSGIDIIDTKERSKNGYRKAVDDASQILSTKDRLATLAYLETLIDSEMRFVNEEFLIPGYDMLFEFYNDAFVREHGFSILKGDFYTPFQTKNIDFMRNFELKTINRHNLATASGFVKKIKVGANNNLLISDGMAKLLDFSHNAAGYVGYNQLLKNYQELSMSRGNVTNVDNVGNSLFNKGAVDKNANFGNFNSFINLIFERILGYSNINGFERMFNKFLNFQTSALMNFNVGVMLRQPLELSQFVALYGLNPAKLSAAYARNFAKNTELRQWLMENNPSFYLRVSGGVTAEFAFDFSLETATMFLDKQNRNMRKLNLLSSRLDVTTFMAVFEVLAHEELHKAGLSEKDKGTVEYEKALQKANERYNKIANTAEPSMTTAFRAPALTDKNPFMRIITRFQAHAMQKVANITFAVYKNKIKGGRGFDKEVGKAILAYLLDAIFYALTKAGALYILGEKMIGKWGKEDNVELFLNNFIMDGMVGGIPIVTMFARALRFRVDSSGVIKFGASFYNAAEIPVIADVTKLMQDTATLMQKFDDPETFWAKAYKVFENFMNIIGMPLRNARKIILAPLNWLSNNGVDWAMDVYGWFNDTTREEMIQNELAGRQKGSYRQMQTILGDKMDNNTIDEIIDVVSQASVETGKDFKINFEEDDAFAKDGTKYKISKETQNYLKDEQKLALSNLISSKEYRKLDAVGKAKAIRKLVTFFNTIRKNKTLGINDWLLSNSELKRLITKGYTFNMHTKDEYEKNGKKYSLAKYRNAINKETNAGINSLKASKEYQTLSHADKQKAVQRVINYYYNYYKRINNGDKLEQKSIEAIKEAIFKSLAD